MKIGWDAATEERFQQKVRKETLEAYRLATLLAVGLFPAFSILDWFTQHEHFLALTVIRYLSALVFLLLYLGSRRKLYPGTPFQSGVLLLSFCSLSITAMCIVVGGYQTPYYAGVNLVTLAAVMLFPWSARTMAIAVAMSISVFSLGVLAYADFHISDGPIFINNMGFLLSTGIVGVSAARLLDRLRRQSFARLVEVEQAREDLKRYDQIKSQFFANVSHELRTPLTLILGPAERLLAGGSLSRNQTSLLELIDRNGRVLLKHVNDLLDVAKMEAGRMTLEYSDADLARILRIVGDHFRGVADRKKIRFTLEAPDSLPAQVDVDKIERVLMNLLSNAFKFTPDQGSIRCTLASGEPGRVRIAVADSGPGIPPSMRQAVFERFFQVEESTRRRYGGTGLGLAIAKELVELHGGTAQAGKAKEGGAEVSIEIPAHAPEGVVVKPRVAQALHPIQTGDPWLLSTLTDTHALATNAPAASAEDRPQVLVVEDHPDVREYIRGILESRFKVVSAAGGREGLELALKLSPDLVLSDIMMPDMSGVDLLREIRSRRELDAIQVVMLTAKADDELRIRLLQEGAQDYLLKPFSAEEVVTRISNLIAIKRTKEILSEKLHGQETALESLAREAIEHKARLEEALHFVRAARDEAKNALEARDEFISIASHELKTPITAMKLQNELVRLRLTKARPDSSEIGTLSSLVDRNGAQLVRLNRLIEDMLDLSRINSGRLKIERAPAELTALVQGVIERLLPQLSSAGIRLDFRKEGPIPGEWDCLRIEQVVTNLLNNAAKYAPNTQVDVRVFREGDRAKIQVKDQGHGIDKIHQKRIFERFERATAATGVTGLGLGLYISRKIVEEHGGRIGIESELGEGSLFTVELPLRIHRQESSA